MQWNDDKIQVIRELCENEKYKERNEIHRATFKLGCCERTIKRRIQSFLKFGEKSFDHGNVNRMPVNKINITEVFDFIEKHQLENCNFEELSRLLDEYANIGISESCIRTRFLALGLVSPQSTRKVRRRLRRLLEEKEKKAGMALTIDEANTLDVLQIEAITGDFHPSKSRSKYMGERIEMDTCFFEFFMNNNTKYALHVVIDDATSYILGLYLDEQETLNGYYHITQQMLSKYGIPYEIRTDRRTVFTYVSNLQTKKTKDKPIDTLTNYGFAMQKLGVDLKCCSDPRFKPRVERANGTLKGMLTSRFTLENITTLEDANRYLEETFIDYYNQLFGHITRQDVNTNRIKKVEDRFTHCTDKQIHDTLVVIEGRKVNNGGSIKFKNKVYALYDDKHRLNCLPPGEHVSVIRTIDDKELYATNKRGNCYDLVVVPEAVSFSKEFDSISDKSIVMNKIKSYRPDSLEHWDISKMTKYKKKTDLIKHTNSLYAKWQGSPTL